MRPTSRGEAGAGAATATTKHLRVIRKFSPQQPNQQRACSKQPSSWRNRSACSVGHPARVASRMVCTLARPRANQILISSAADKVSCQLFCLSLEGAGIASALPAPSARPTALVASSASVPLTLGSAVLASAPPDQNKRQTCNWMQAERLSKLAAI